jgi:hypothetical protein
VGRARIVSAIRRARAPTHNSRSVGSGSSTWPDSIESMSGRAAARVRRRLRPMLASAARFQDCCCRRWASCVAQRDQRVIARVPIRARNRWHKCAYSPSVTNLVAVESRQTRSHGCVWMASILALL